MSDRFSQWDSMVRNQRSCEDAYQEWLRTLEERHTVHAVDFDVDNPPPKMSWWQRLKLWWRFIW